MIEEIPTLSEESVAGEFGFKIAWSRYSTRVEFDVKEIDPSNKHDGESYLTGSVKWDGCSDLRIGYHHFCSPRDYIMHFALLKHLYVHSLELMGEDAHEADKWPTK